LTGGPLLSSLTLHRARAGLQPESRSRPRSPTPPPRHGQHANGCARPFISNRHHPGWVPRTLATAALRPTATGQHRFAAASVRRRRRPLEPTVDAMKSATLSGTFAASPCAPSPLGMSRPPLYPRRQPPSPIPAAPPRQCRR
jgi:hypothetical protein